MHESDALPMLSAMAQPTRLKVLAMLARAGGAGMASGEIADAIGIPRHLMSSHLAVLSRANAVVARKTGRAVVYSLNGDRLSELGRYIDSLVLPIEGADSPGANERA
ncbi:ArsR/SmtB family transcription factor [Sphingomonas sp. R86521]|uniref:ArsR/SmtB family transcription factor n=1 Tax=Sphingomonas sp. R86521 TaxID=3093860 RepID=UPI0036D334DB